jgi:hypothetical protein
MGNGEWGIRGKREKEKGRIFYHPFFLLPSSFFLLPSF